MASEKCTKGLKRLEKTKSLQKCEYYDLNLLQIQLKLAYSSILRLFAARLKWLKGVLASVFKLK